jgi:hypothetical protein
MSELHEWVPDGDPCPRHPTEKSRLFHLPGVGLFSQCAICIDEFLAWFSWNSKRRPDPPPIAAKPIGREMPQLSLLKETRP